MNRYTIFQCAQLLERLRPLQRTWFPLHKLEQRGPAKRINALVSQSLVTGLLISEVWNRRAREIESAAISIKHHCNLVGRQDLRLLREWMRRGHDSDLPVFLKRSDETINQARIRQRLVALNLDDA